MVLQTGMHPAAIKDSATRALYIPKLEESVIREVRNVKAPGGCTFGGLLGLEDGRVRSTVPRCILATALHAGGLGRAPRK